ncbi:MAG: hypothetical protein JRJ00_08010 [Deltaproteobacteria bacterium]|nr:hypothetical protein [Deltaproteobacteria bacterium]
MYCDYGCGADRDVFVCSDCIVQSALKGEDDAENLILDVLRRFRDEVLADNLAGMGLIKLYYEHSPEMVKILLSNPDIKFRITTVLKELMPFLQIRLEGEEMAVSGQILMETEKLLDDFMLVASPQLQPVIARIKEEVVNGKIFDLVQE